MKEVGMEEHPVDNQDNDKNDKQLMEGSMAKSTIFNKNIFKKWWFWALVVIVLLIGAMTSGDEPSTDSDRAQNAEQTQNVGTLPKVEASQYVGKEGLVAFKELSDKKYDVTAKYVNEQNPQVNEDLTEQFKAASVSSCSDRLGWDAYIVSGLKQDGDKVAITTTNQANSNQDCPADTENDL